MDDEVKEILGRLDEAVKALENVENDTPTDVFEDIGVLASDVAQVLYAEDAETKAKEKKDAIMTIASILQKVNKY